ncbi:MAG: alpha/beta hydrolase [Prolixibacteraceae bacterium]|nr:alpha/beta hydrolase [Prolixibacteraceae bacterium]
MYIKERNQTLRIFHILSLFIICSHIALAADPPGIPGGWSDGFVYDNGVRIHYYHAVPAPEKPVIVMVHGVTDNGLCWTTLTWKLQNDYDIYMLDARGHGLSDPFTSSDDGETLVKDVVGFVKAMNIEKPILIGHSMGAATVMRVGAEYPDLAQKIIMLDPFLSRPMGTQSGGNHQAPMENPVDVVPEKLKVNMFGDPETLVKQNNYSLDDLLKKGKNDNPKWDIVDIKYWALSKKQYHGPYSPEAWNAMRGTMNIGDALSKIKVPSLILKADTSPEGRKANQEAVDGLARVKLLHIDGAAHNLHHDELEQTVKAITEFLLKN